MTAEKKKYLERRGGENEKEQSEETRKIKKKDTTPSPLRRSERLKRKMEGQQESGTAASTNHNKNTRKRRLSDLQSLCSEPPSKRRMVNGDEGDSDDLDIAALCDWEGELRNLNKHCERCLYELILCAHCGDDVLRNDLDQHEAECLQFPLQCDKCDEDDIPRYYMEVHLRGECPMADTNCPLCSATMLRKDVESHLDTECQENAISCAIGCGQTVKRREMKDHIESNAVDHLKHVMKTVDELRECNEKLRMDRETDRKKAKRTHAELKANNMSLKQRINAVERSTGQLTTSLRLVRAIMRLQWPQYGL